MSRVGFLYHAIYMDHDTGRFHPERNSRLEAILRQLNKDEVDSKLTKIKAREAEVSWIEEIHDHEYVDRVHSACVTHLPYLDTEDCPISPLTYDAALWAVGGIFSAIDEIMNDNIDRAFCAVRPPGHHAEVAQAMGFCFFNNVAIAARYLQKEYDFKKIFIFDWDVHHGNGTQHIFEKDPTVFYCSMHEDPRFCYPGTGFETETGLEEGKGYTLNCPIIPETHDEEYLKIFDSQVLPAIDEFEPDFIIISAGFDAHEKDPLAQENLTDEAYIYMTEAIIKKAEKHCKGKLLSVLEGGYNLFALGHCVSKHIQTMLNK